jgi:hypothetical protein
VLQRCPSDDERVSPDGLTLFRRGERAGFWYSGLASEESDFTESREVRIVVTDVGPQEVQFFLVKRSARGNLSIRLPAAEDCGRIEVGQGDAERIFIVRPHAGSLAQAYEKTR